MPYDFDVVIGWDFGHGENAVEAKRMELSGDSSALNLDAQKDREIPTVILYKDDTVKIGNEARKNMEAIPYFKDRPGLWDSKISGYTKKKMMSDYFHVLMENIHKYNEDFIHDEDRILLLVGCPSSKSWMQPPERIQAYEELIREATGVAKVIVMPESRAALFSAAQSKRIQVNTTNGAIVFDFGSSTADFTYMKLGDYMIDRSWTLGASHVERSMLKKILEDNALTPGDIWYKEVGKLELELREQKERYYSDGAEGPYILAPVIMDDSGDPVTKGENKKGETIYSRRTLSYQVDDDFMDAVTRRIAFHADENGVDQGEKSWYEHCRSFFLSAKRMLDAPDLSLPYKTIVLTGGASNMSFVKPLCEEIFGQEVIIELNPSHSVSKGLCFTGKTDLLLPELLEKGIREVHKQSDEEYEVMVNTCVNAFTDKVYTSVTEVLKQVAALSQDITIDQLKEKITESISNTLTKNTVMEIVDKARRDWLAKCKVSVVNAANNATKSIYPDSISASQFQMPRQPDYDFLNDFNITIDGSTMIGEFDFNTLIGKVVKAVVIGATFVIFCFIFPYLAFIAAIVADVVADVIASRGDRSLSQGLRNRLKNEFINHPDKQKQKISESIRTDIKTTFQSQLGENNEKQYSCLDDATGAAFDVVTLRNFEHRIS